jgi:hypothetical protein
MAHLDVHPMPGEHGAAFWWTFRPTCSLVVKRALDLLLTGV